MSKHAKRRANKKAKKEAADQAQIEEGGGLNVIEETKEEGQRKNSAKRSRGGGSRKNSAREKGKNEPPGQGLQN